MSYPPFLLSSFLPFSFLLPLRSLLIQPHCLHFWPLLRGSSHRLMKITPEVIITTDTSTGFLCTPGLCFPGFYLSHRPDHGRQAPKLWFTAHKRDGEHWTCEEERWLIASLNPNNYLQNVPGCLRFLPICALLIKAVLFMLPVFPECLRGAAKSQITACRISFSPSPWQGSIVSYRTDGSQDTDLCQGSSTALSAKWL